MILTLLLVGFFFFLIARLYFGFTVKEIKTTIYEFSGMLFGLAITGYGAWSAFKKKITTEPGAYTKEIIRRIQEEKKKEEKKIRSRYKYDN